MHCSICTVICILHCRLLSGTIKKNKFKSQYKFVENGLRQIRSQIHDSGILIELLISWILSVVLYLFQTTFRGPSAVSETSSKIKIGQWIMPEK
jgi:hypothetical protein